MTSYFLPDPVDGDRLPRGAAARAVEALRTYDLVLLTDRLHDDALWIDRVFNGQDYGARARLNTSAQYRDAASGPFPESFAKHFADVYPYEHDVYDAARERYPETRAWLRDEGGDRGNGPRAFRSRCRRRSTRSTGLRRRGAEVFPTACSPPRLVT